jgi:hypothetical protein
MQSQSHNESLGLIPNNLLPPNHHRDQTNEDESMGSTSDYYSADENTGAQMTVDPHSVDPHFFDFELDSDGGHPQASSVMDTNQASEAMTASK